MRAFATAGSRTCAVLVVVFALLGQAARGGPLRDRLLERRAKHQQYELLEDDAPAARASLPAGVTVLRDVRYGSDARQRFDVYLPKQADHAPVIFMVHGGGWRRGDKSMQTVVENKVARWVPEGFIVISANYRLLPDANPLQQADDIAAALASAQQQAASWGGDRSRFILMGHSAGAHLVSLLAASPAIAAKHGASRWLGTVSLDSATLDVVQTMEGRHLRLHDAAFGSDAAFWRAASPYHQLHAAGAPFLAVCSTQRSDSCPQARRFVKKAESVGMRASVLEQDLSHKEINQQLGENPRYTDAVEAFIETLDPALQRMLARGGRGR